MKKIILTLAMALVATNINAQLVVDSLGRVGIGTETPLSLLSAGGDGHSDAVLSCTMFNKHYGLYTSFQGNEENSVCGSNTYINNHGSGDCYGGKFRAVSFNNSNNSQKAIGLMGWAGNAFTSIGIFGGRGLSTITPENFAGVYGSESVLPNFNSYSGRYAGYFSGKVRVTNGIYATVLSPTASTSSLNGQSSTTVLSNRDESVTDKLSQVQTVQFFRYNPTKETSTTKVDIKDVDIDNMSIDELDSLTETMGEVEPERYLSPIQYGLDADQLKAVYPELVYEDANGNVSINYVEMVPLLVQSINELKAELAELKGSSAKRTKAKAEATGIKESVSDIDIVRMDQNKPNPFSESTVISLNIPRETQSATIFIYDMSGKQVQSLPVSERGETNITVYARDLTPGMYIYTLVVDGKVAVTRRIIVER